MLSLCTFFSKSSNSHLSLASLCSHQQSFYPFHHLSAHITISSSLLHHIHHYEKQKTLQQKGLKRMTLMMQLNYRIDTYQLHQSTSSFMSHHHIRCHSLPSGVGFQTTSFGVSIITSPIRESNTSKEDTKSSLIQTQLQTKSSTH